MEHAAPWDMKAKIQTGLKEVVQIHREFVCQWLFSTYKRACRNLDDTHCWRVGKVYQRRYCWRLLCLFTLSPEVSTPCHCQRICGRWTDPGLFFYCSTLTVALSRSFSHPCHFCLLHRDLSRRHPSRSLLAWGIVLMSTGAQKFPFHTSRAAAPVWVREERQTQVSWAMKVFKNKWHSSSIVQTGQLFCFFHLCELLWSARHCILQLDTFSFLLHLLSPYFWHFDYKDLKVC